MQVSRNRIETGKTSKRAVRAESGGDRGRPESSARTRGASTRRRGAPAPTGRSLRAQAEHARYHRDQLILLLDERVTFERSAFDLYGDAIEALQSVRDDVVERLIEPMHLAREQEAEHASWLEEMLGNLGGVPSRSEMGRAVMLETEGPRIAVEKSSTPQAVLHALLGSELMDNEGWMVLLAIAREAGDREAVRQLEERLRHEREHLELIRNAFFALTRRDLLVRGGRTPAIRTGRASNGEGRARANDSRSRTTNGGSERARSGGAHHGAAMVTTDRDEIRRWVEERGGSPARVRRTGRADDPGILRIDFPGFSGEETLEHIDWNTWFDAFDENDLAFLHQDETADGRQSRFSKLVSRDTVARRRKGERHASVHDRRH